MNLNNNNNSISNNNNEQLILGLPHFILLKIINNVGNNTDLICLLMTSKLFFVTLRTKYCKSLRFKLDKFTKELNPICLKSFDTIYSRCKTLVFIDDRISANNRERNEEEEININEVNINANDFKKRPFIKRILPLSTKTLALTGTIANKLQDIIPSNSEKLILLDSDNDPNCTLPPSLTSIQWYNNGQLNGQINLQNLTALRSFSLEMNTDPYPSASSIRFPVGSTSLKKLEIKRGISDLKEGWLPKSITDLDLGATYYLGTVSLPPNLVKLAISLDSPIFCGMIPSTVKDLILFYLSQYPTIEEGALPDGLEGLDLIHYRGPINPTIVPNSVTRLGILGCRVSNEKDMILPPGLIKFSQSIPRESLPACFPSTTKDITYFAQCNSHTQYLPTSLESFACQLVKVSPTDPIYSIPTNIKIVDNCNYNNLNNNNNNGTIHHTILPPNVKNIFCRLPMSENEFIRDGLSFRLDQIINSTSIESITFCRFPSSNYSTTISIRRLDTLNRAVLLIENGTLFGGIIKQKQLPNHFNVGTVEYDILYINFIQSEYDILPTFSDKFLIAQEEEDDEDDGEDDDEEYDEEEDSYSTHSSLEDGSWEEEESSNDDE
ncbi:hypothetical protein DFA_02784 [Cavenderia fasciculata]|uniref:Uncharacterized protein n=1 Tax=Cavenderia fasciculata TaxID=261658 RepID=F4PIA7_CACFS|nr:uncharacterized protein DFA_02784 [Cavenderia fasciculata]EGG24541.1 hypothetical protein DFA_02784 [Cavenderia fasciculata]|eukprot:XP_004362392.1 hypothetical protein DFA_02784 [Cavenderia fasciculata]